LERTLDWEWTDWEWTLDSEGTLGTGDHGGAELHPVWLHPVWLHPVERVAPAHPPSSPCAAGRGLALRWAGCWAASVTTLPPPSPTPPHTHSPTPPPAPRPAQWFAGDTLNLLGCLLQGKQLPTTTLLAM
jgi:hypothetical protein